MQAGHANVFVLLLSKHWKNRLFEKADGAGVGPDFAVAGFDGSNDWKNDGCHRNAEEQGEPDEYKAERNRDQKENEFGEDPVEDDLSVTVNDGRFIFFELPQNNWRNNPGERKQVG